MLGAPSHVKMKSVKNSPDTPAKASDFRRIFSDKIFLREAQEKDCFSIYFKASMKDAKAAVVKSVSATL